MTFAGWISGVLKKSQHSEHPSSPQHLNALAPHQIQAEIPQPPRRSGIQFWKGSRPKSPQMEARMMANNEMEAVNLRHQPPEEQPKHKIVIDLLSDDEFGDDGAEYNLALLRRASRPYQINPRSKDPPFLQAAADVVDDNLHPPVNLDGMWEDMFGDDLDIHNDGQARTMQDVTNAECQQQRVQSMAHAAPDSAAVLDPKARCFSQVTELFPGICHKYVSKLYDTVSQSYEDIVSHIVDQESYPKAKDVQNSMKRKREVDQDEEAALKYGAANRDMADNKVLVRNILRGEFLSTPMEFIDTCLKQNGFRLFSAYRILEEAEQTHDVRPTYNKIKNPRKVPKHYTKENLQVYIDAARSLVEREIYEELRVAWKFKDKENVKRQHAAALKLAEQENERIAIEEGTMCECNCCCDNFPWNRMVHCDSPETMHWFCRGCALTSAENEVGNSRYELFCMAMGGCPAGFSNQQRAEFLDEKTIIGLERNHQEANLRMAGIENLASCPFCPYAAEYPPVQENREFVCKRPECEKVSCRLCNLESHVPMTCEESAKHNGLSIRRQIEEAMSAALIRKCNKCATPFVKLEGCNKMTCTRPNCRNVQCYVCSQSCGYDHFNDMTRGGKAGNCPLFESTETRHDEEVQKAEKAALDKARAEHPEFSEEDLKVQVSDVVKADDARRKANHPRIVAVGGVPPVIINPAHLHLRARGFPAPPIGPQYNLHPVHPLVQRPQNYLPVNPDRGVYVGEQQRALLPAPDRGINQGFGNVPIPNALPVMQADQTYAERLQRGRALRGFHHGRIAAANVRNIAAVVEPPQNMWPVFQQRVAMHDHPPRAGVLADLERVELEHANLLRAEATALARAQRDRIHARLSAYRRQYEQ